jgi:hypothetical protein
MDGRPSANMTTVAGTVEGWGVWYEIHSDIERPAGGFARHHVSFRSRRPARIVTNVYPKTDAIVLLGKPRSIVLSVDR